MPEFDLYAVFHVQQQSLSICCALAAIGGLLEVGATAVTAIPAVREQEGRPVSAATYRYLLLANLSLQVRACVRVCVSHRSDNLGCNGVGDRVIFSHWFFLVLPLVMDW